MSSSLTEIVLPQRPPNMPCPTAVTDGDSPEPVRRVGAVQDPRDPRGRRYPLVSILAAAVCAVIAGACTFAAVTDWVRFQDRTVWQPLGFCGRDAKGAETRIIAPACGFRPSCRCRAAPCHQQRGQPRFRRIPLIHTGFFRALGD